MKTLEVTDEQYAFIQHLREEISEQVVGKYGFVRERDAIQFLIDNLDGDLEVDDEFESTAADLPAVVEVATDDENEITYDENEGAIEVDPDEDGDETDADDRETDADDDDADDEDAGADDQDDEESEADSEADEDESEADADDASGEADETSGGAGDDSDGASGDADGSGAADDDDMLDRMMSLLETHDDKWEESPSGDFRYRVTLPDGETEDVQTKDDVRALLFKNYR